MRNKNLSFVLLLVIVFAASSVMAASTITLTVGSPTGLKDGVVKVPITVSDASTVAGAAFTVTYNTTDLTLQTVGSTFFDTFAAQFADTRITPAYTGDTTVTVDGTIYDQPLIDGNVISATGMPIAAARALPETDTTKKTIFELSFVLNDPAKAGTYPKTYDIAVIPTTLSYTPAGYALDGNPETIDLIIGFESATSYTSTTYPVLLDNTDYATKVTKGVLTFVEDTDGDGIGDTWETTNFGNLTTATATTDTDSDGYDDIVEFNNFSNNLSGGTWDPKVQDPPDGPGYHCETDNRCGGGGVTLTLNVGWNLVSLPVTPADNSLTALFPDATVAYSFVGSYQQVTSLEPGMGYWVKVTTGGNYDITGTEFANYTKSDLAAGWHLLGAVNAADIVPITTPANSISVMYGFDQSYSQATGVSTGKGYWIKVTQTCDLTVE